LERCRATVRHVELASDPLFQDTFIESTQFAQTPLASASRQVL
jgi:hypothetical protein